MNVLLRGSGDASCVTLKTSALGAQFLTFNFRLRLRLSIMEKYLDWRDVAILLTSDAAGATSSSSKASPTTSSTASSKLRIRVLDTIFLNGSPCSSNRQSSSTLRRQSQQPLRRSSPYHNHGRSSFATSTSVNTRTSLPTISDWIYTSKQGELIRRATTPCDRGNTSSSKNRRSSSTSSSNIGSSNNKSMWTHACDRFARIALSDTANSSGPRIVAVGRGGGSGSTSSGSSSGDSSCVSSSSQQGFDVRFHLTAEQFKRDLGGGGRAGTGTSVSSSCSLLSKCRAIQCYVRPRGGVDTIFRAVYTLDGGSSSRGRGSSHRRPRVDVLMVEDGSTVGASCASITPLDDASSTTMRNSNGSDFIQDLGAVRKEVQMTTIDVVAHVEAVLRDLHGPTKSAAEGPQLPTVASVSLDFVLDDKRQLWLSHTEGMSIVGTSSGTCHSDGVSSENNENNSSGSPSGSLLPASTTKPLNPYSEQVNTTANTPIVDEGADVAGGGGKQIQPSTNKRLTTDSSNATSADTLMSTAMDSSKSNQIVLSPNSDIIALREARDKAAEEARLLRGRVDELEDALQSTRTRLENSAVESSSKLQRVNLELKQTSCKLQAKDDQHAQAILELESQINAYKADVARLESASTTTYHSSSGGADVVPESLERDLLVKIDSLQSELTLAHRKWGQERRELASSHAAAEQERAEKHRVELAEQRAAISALEDNTVSQKEKTRDVEKERLLLMQKLATANHSIEVARNESMNLRDELDSIKQTLHAAQSSTQGGHGGASSSDDNALLIVDTSCIGDAESNVRTLNNKVNFLEAQLQTEVTVKEECMSCIATLRREKDSLVDSHRCKDQQIAQIQEKLRTAMERPSSKDIDRLQEEARVLQLQLDDTRKSAIEARRREEDANSQFTKEQLLVKSIKRELESARDENVVAIKEIDKLKEARLNAAANEGELRRLDNERQYLRNQLHVEITAKAELMKKINEAEQQVKVAKEGSKEEARSLAVELKKEKHSRDLVESQLRDAKQILEAEVGLQKKEIEELRQAYAKTRDQVRIEQTAAEKILAVGQRTAEELKAAQDELMHLRSNADDAAARHNETTRTISDSIKKAEEIRVQEISRLQDETQRALQQASDTKRDMVNLRSSMRLEQTRAAKTFAAHHLAVLYAQRLRCEKQRAFSAWCLHSSVARTKRIESKGVSDAIGLAVASARNECNSKWQERCQKIQQISEEKSKEMGAKLVQETVRLQDKAKLDQERAVRNERDRIEHVLREKDVLWAKKEKEIHSTHQSMIAKITCENNKNLENVQTKAQKRIDAAASEAEVSIKERQQIIISDCNKRWEAKLADIPSKFDREKQEAVANAAKEHERMLEQEREKFEAKESSLQIEFQGAVEEAVSAETIRIAAGNERVSRAVRSVLEGACRSGKQIPRSRARVSTTPAQG